MRIEFVGKLPRHLSIAVSGGPDSMAILDFLANKDPIVMHFNHGTEHGAEAEAFVRDYCDKRGFRLKVGQIERDRNKDESPEEYWRNCRYDFLFDNFEYGNGPLITCHTLDDQVEQWIFSSLRGKPTLIPYSRRVVIRPFIATKKEALLGWCERKNVPYLIDPSNDSDLYSRSYIRKHIVPHALQVNPGLYKVIKKKVMLYAP